MSENICIFCKIIKKEAKASILYEDDEILAFLDIRPVNEGHSLIIPKKHHPTVETIPKNVYEKLFVVGREILVKIKRSNPEIDGFNYLIANGKAAGQDVFHVHLHIIPRYYGDGFGFKFGPNYGKLLSIEERNSIRDKIIKN